MTGIETFIDDMARSALDDGNGGRLTSARRDAIIAYAERNGISIATLARRIGRRRAELARDARGLLSDVVASGGATKLEQCGAGAVDHLRDIGRAVVGLCGCLCQGVAKPFKRAFHLFKQVVAIGSPGDEPANGLGQHGNGAGKLGNAVDFTHGSPPADRCASYVSDTGGTRNCSEAAE